MTTALLLIDIQNDYFSGGAMELVEMETAAGNAAMLLGAARDAGLPVFHLRHLSTHDGATFFLPGTSGAETSAVVAPVEGEIVVEKNFPNGFRETDLQDQLQRAGVDALVIAGAMSHMCVDGTTRAAADLGYDCTVAADACATCDLAFGGEIVPAAQAHGSFMAALGQAYGVVVTAREAAAEFGSGAA
jgi:nicotinamidase-related amidase